MALGTVRILASPHVAVRRGAGASATGDGGHGRGRCPRTARTASASCARCRSAPSGDQERHEPPPAAAALSTAAPMAWWGRGLWLLGAVPPCARYPREPMTRRLRSPGRLRADVRDVQFDARRRGLVRRCVARLKQRADVKGLAVAAAGGGQPLPHRLGALDERGDLGQLALGEFAEPLVRAPSRVSRSSRDSSRRPLPPRSRCGTIRGTSTRSLTTNRWGYSCDSVGFPTRASACTRLRSAGPGGHRSCSLTPPRPSRDPMTIRRRL